MSLRLLPSAQRLPVQVLARDLWQMLREPGSHLLFFAQILFQNAPHLVLARLDGAAMSIL